VLDDGQVPDQSSSGSREAGSRARPLPGRSRPRHPISSRKGRTGGDPAGPDYDGGS
jgi:hypothetical protein